MNKNNLVKGTICTLLIVSLLCLSILPSVAISASTEKLSDNLIETLTKMSSNDELEVTVFFSDMDDSDLRERLIDRTGKDIEVYEDKNKFYKEVVPDIKVNGKSIKSIVSSDDISTSAFKLNNEESPFSLELRKDINLEITNEMNEYLADKRAVRSDMNKEYLEDFKAIFDKEDIVFASNYIEMMIVRLDKSEILALSNNPQVDGIYYSECNGGKEAWHIPQLIEADSTTGTGSDNYNDGFGYDGTGVNIGIIEHEYGRFDENHYSLAEAVNSQKLDVFTIYDSSINENAGKYISSDGVVSDHSTVVTSIICGRQVTVNVYGHDRTYEGLARGANVYQTFISPHDTQGKEFYDAVELLIEHKNINIINFSGRLLTQDPVTGNEGVYLGYSEYDRAVDEYVHNYDVVFVKSAGNTANEITAPGNAFNAITVGCVEAKTGSGMPQPNFEIKSDSAWNEYDYLPNKPDVVAPGTMITLPTSDNSFESITDGGTSFAAPVVTGLAAQLMQDDIICLANPNYVKNLIMCGASHDLLASNEVDSWQLREKSGTGMVNAVNSFAAKDNSWFEVCLYYNTNTNYRTIKNIYLEPGQTIKAVLSYHKEEADLNITEEYGNNLDLRLIHAGSGIVRQKSESTNNNVEVIEYTEPYGGTLSLQVRMVDSILSADGNMNLHDCVTWRVY